MGERIMIGLNIEMPKSCRDCPCWEEEGYCIPLGIYVGENKPPDCPLMEIVKCKECKYTNRYGGRMECTRRWPPMETDAEFYCAAGEKEEE